MKTSVVLSGMDSPPGRRLPLLLRILLVAVPTAVVLLLFSIQQIYISNLELRLSTIEAQVRLPSTDQLLVASLDFSSPALICLIFPLYLSRRQAALLRFSLGCFCTALAICEHNRVAANQSCSRPQITDAIRPVRATNRLRLRRWNIDQYGRKKKERKEKIKKHLLALSLAAGARLLEKSRKDLKKGRDRASW